MFSGEMPLFELPPHPVKKKTKKISKQKKTFFTLNLLKWHDTAKKQKILKNFKRKTKIFATKTDRLTKLTAILPKLSTS